MQKARNAKHFYREISEEICFYVHNVRCEAYLRRRDPGECFYAQERAIRSILKYVVPVWG